MWKNNGLSIVLAFLFLGSLVAHSFSGWKQFNGEEREHGRREVSYGRYLHSAEFGESVFENWESEFLQMSMYVVLTVFLYQKGSSESKKHGGGNEVDDDPEAHRDDPGVPNAVRQGGWRLSIYRNSLSLALAALFAVSFLLHAATGAVRYNQKEAEHGSTERVTTAGYMKTSQFWYESTQNWQSEFLAVLAIVVLSIRLRQWGSPESKPVHAAHEDTGSG
ncbi:MAG: DUF6766 family protein [Acidobacteriota bacterium]